MMLHNGVNWWARQTGAGRQPSIWFFATTPDGAVKVAEVDGIFDNEPCPSKLHVAGVLLVTVMAAHQNEGQQEEQVPDDR